MANVLSRFQLQGRRALVTGGNRGIGLGIARALAEAGADLVLVARDQKKLEQARESLHDTGRDIATAVYDLSEVDGIEAFYQEIATEGVDILVNNAAISRRVSAEMLSLDEWRSVIDIDLNAVFAFCQAFARERFASGKQGKIINIGSLMCSATRPSTSAYTAAKGGVLMLTKSLAIDWADRGVLVNAIGPGYISTDLTEPLVNDPEFSAWVENRCPLGRWGKPDDIGPAAVFLASPASDFITGQILYVDGGWLATF